MAFQTEGREGVQRGCGCEGDDLGLNGKID